MVQTIKISELTDGIDLKTNQSKGIFSQNNASYKATNRPQAANQISVRNQDQLEAELGTDLEILGNVTIYNDSPAPIPMDKPFKIKDDSAISLNSSNRYAAFNYTGNDAFIRNSDDSINGALSCIIDNVNLIGSGINKMIDLKLNPATIGNFSLIRDATILNFKLLGTIEGISHSQSLVNYEGWSSGLIIKNCIQSNLERVSTGLPILDYATFLSWFNSVSPSFVALNDVKANGFNANNNLLYFDPNSLPISLYRYSNCSTPDGLGNITHGTGIVTITQVTSNSGKATFHAASDMKITQGQVVTLQEFTGHPAYNGTVVVTGVGGLGQSFNTDLDYVGDDTTGELNKKSLDSTDTRVLSSTNPRRADSMWIGKISQDASETVTIDDILAGGDKEILGTYSGYQLERFIAPSSTLPRLQDKDTAVKRYLITYSAVLKKSSQETLGLILRKNIATTNEVVSVDPTNFPVGNTFVLTSNTEIVELDEDDTLDVRLKNYGGVEADGVSVKNTTMVVSRA